MPGIIRILASGGILIVKWPMPFFAILMASGFSNRYGARNKLLEPFRGKPLASHTLDLVCGIGCFEEIFLVYADKNVAALAAAAVSAGFPVRAVFNPSPEKGQGESARLGVAAAPAAADGYFFFPCDQPLLDAGTVRLLLGAAGPGRIVEPAGRHSPCFFSASFRGELLALNPGEQPRLLKTRHPRAVVAVEVPNPLALADVDTPADLEKLAAIC